MPATLNIRIAEPKDAPYLYHLHTAAIRTVCARHYSPEIVDGWLLGRSPAGYLPPIGRRAIFVAELDHKIVGFGEAAPGAVIAVYVDPAVMGNGVGRLLLMHGIRVARHAHSGPIRVESTLNAAPFYAHHGFVEIECSAVRRNHVDVPIIVMEMPAG